MSPNPNPTTGAAKSDRPNVPNPSYTKSTEIKTDNDFKAQSNPNEVTSKDADPHETAVQFLLHYVMRTGDGDASRLAQSHLETIHKDNPPAETESYEDRMWRQKEEAADAAAAEAAAQKAKDEADIAAADDKAKAEADKHRKDLDAASAKEAPAKK